MTDATASAILSHAAGLHARPSLKLTMLAKTFAAKIELALKPEGPWIDAKSIVKVMATKAPMGSTLHFRASGENAQGALDAILALIARDFDEGSEAKQPAGAPADG
ncbi:MAG TPA: HPr family phosphocarrier protein [Dongiaceae bacterium]|jgi:phosphocarrier protein|nr:HPr family phosphocarrier protein [Dongiaceae bacterium]